jgi:hypothetical protein
MKAAERKLTDLEHAAYRAHSMAAVTRLILDDLLDFSTVEADRDGRRSLPCVAPRLSIHQTHLGSNASCPILPGRARPYPTRLLMQFLNWEEDGIRRDVVWPQPRRWGLRVRCVSRRLVRMNCADTTPLVKMAIAS